MSGMSFARLTEFPGNMLWGAQARKHSFIISFISGEGGGWGTSRANHDPETMPAGGRALTVPDWRHVRIWLVRGGPSLPARRPWRS